MGEHCAETVRVPRPISVAGGDHLATVPNWRNLGSLTVARAVIYGLIKAGYVVSSADEIADLKARLDEAQLNSIEARNPGIDMDEVRRYRAEHSDGDVRGGDG